MTHNQIEYWKNQETQRSNLAAERENLRSNQAKERETYRSNLERERETRNRNLNDYLLGMLNYSEISRHNRATEMQQNRYYKEIERSNQAKEIENKRSNLANERETHRSNLASENIRMLQQQIERRKADTAQYVAQTQARKVTNDYILGSRNLDLMARQVAETQRSNKAREQENIRSNIARESETARHNTEMERQGAIQLSINQQNAETARINTDIQSRIASSTYGQLVVARARQEEDERSNRANEKLKHEQNVVSLISSIFRGLK